MSTNQALDYYELGDALARARSAVNPDECQGLFAGLICASGCAAAHQWMPEVFDDFDPRDLLQSAACKQLQLLYERTLAGLNSPDLDFELLLPDAADSLRDRAQALAGWCAGFLSGLGLGGLRDGAQVPDEVSELFDDLAQIARLDFELDDPDEEEQAAFEEVVEYVRVGVLVINEELQPSQVSPQLQ
jgi:yecA family protein